MTYTLFGLGGIPFWTPSEVRQRYRIKQTLVDAVEDTLMGLTQMWRLVEVETPTLIPYAHQSEEEGADAFLLRDPPSGTGEWCLREDMSACMHAIAGQIIQDTNAHPPLCVYQSGKVFRRETNDAPTAQGKRYYEFNQLSFHCIYGATSKGAVAEMLRINLLPVVEKIAERPSRLVASTSRNSSETINIEVLLDDGVEWRSVASTARRTDFPALEGHPEYTAFEMTFGLDRLVALSA